MFEMQVDIWYRLGTTQEKDHPRTPVMPRGTVPRNNIRNLQVFKDLARKADSWSKKSQKTSPECLFARTGTHLKRTLRCNVHSIEEGKSR